MLTRKQREVQGAKARKARQTAAANRQSTMARQRQIRQADRSSAASQVKAREVKRATRVAKGRKAATGIIKSNAADRMATRQRKQTAGLAHRQAAMRKRWGI